MSKHAQIFRYWLEYHATDKEKALDEAGQRHAVQMWLEQRENWNLVMQELDAYDAHGNPPPRPEKGE